MKIFQKSLKKLVSFCVLAVLSSVLYAAEPIKIEIVYLPHGPVLNILAEIDDILVNYPEAEIFKYRFEDKNGIKLAKLYGFMEHLPIFIIINDSYKYDVNGKEIEFYNFPSNNSFAPTFQGPWSYEDLSILLDQIAGR